MNDPSQMKHPMVATKDVTIGTVTNKVGKVFDAVTETLRDKLEARGSAVRHVLAEAKEEIAHIEQEVVQEFHDLEAKLEGHEAATEPVAETETQPENDDANDGDGLPVVAGEGADVEAQPSAESTSTVEADAAQEAPLAETQAVPAPPAAKKASTAAAPAKSSLMDKAANLINPRSGAKGRQS
jgi:hypothetical protein